MSDSFKDQPVLAFETPEPWRAWLDANHATFPGGLWLRIYAKATRRPTITYAQALDEALCYGWIDSQKNKDHPDSSLQRFSPRPDTAAPPATAGFQIAGPDAPRRGHPSVRRCAGAGSSRVRADRSPPALRRPTRPRPSTRARR